MKAAARHGARERFRERTPVPASRAGREQEADRAAERMAAPAARGGATFAAATPAAGAPGASPFALPSAPLPAAVRNEFSQALGHDFANVRISADGAAAQLARGFGARALAFGDHVVFGAGQLAPHAAEGRRLLGHELQHVAHQQRAGFREFAFAKTLAEQVVDLQAEISAATDAAALAAAVAQAAPLAAALTTALDTAKRAEPPDGGTGAEGPRDGLLRLVRTLAARAQAAAAVDIAVKSRDTAVEQAALFGLMPAGSGGGPARQQRFFREVAPLAGQKVRAPGAQETTKQWLSAETGAIGKTLTGLDAKGLKGPKDRAASLALSEQLLTEYHQYDPDDPKPDPLGDPAGANVKSDGPQGAIKADCDGYATFGARLLRAQGWATVGFLAIIPDQVLEKDPVHTDRPRSGHAVALASKPLDPADAAKGRQYLGVSNATLLELGGTGVALANDDAAKPPLTALALTVYEKPPCLNYDVYFMPADASGRYDVKLLDPVRNGLSPIQRVRAKP